MTASTPQEKKKRLDPKTIFKRLGENVIGQEAAKKSLAVAWHRRDLREGMDEKLREEIQPSNILMMGPTGVGKTELVRRFANIVQVPLLMTEATRYSGTGWIGSNLESMLTDLFRIAEGMVAKKHEEAGKGSASGQDEDQDEDTTSAEALELAEGGIIFIDEIDKLANSLRAAGGSSVGEDVQRRLLTFVEGASVSLELENREQKASGTPSLFKTHQVLFIAAGAFYVSKPSDLLPELLGRFPNKVNLKSLRREDLYRILKESKSSKAKTEAALLEVKGITIEFKDDGYWAIADAAVELNQWEEDLGARRLNDIIDILFGDLYFSGKKRAVVVVDKKFVEKPMAARLGKAKKQREIDNAIL